MTIETKCFGSKRFLVVITLQWQKHNNYLQTSSYGRTMFDRYSTLLCSFAHTILKTRANFASLVKQKLLSEMKLKTEFQNKPCGNNQNLTFAKRTLKKHFNEMHVLTRRRIFLSLILKVAFYILSFDILYWESLTNLTFLRK